MQTVLNKVMLDTVGLNYTRVQNWLHSKTITIIIHDNIYPTWYHAYAMYMVHTCVSKECTQHTVNMTNFTNQVEQPLLHSQFNTEHAIVKIIFSTNFAITDKLVVEYEITSQKVTKNGSICNSSNRSVCPSVNNTVLQHLQVW